MRDINQYAMKNRTKIHLFLIGSQSLRCIIYHVISRINRKTHRITQDSTAYFSAVFSSITHYKFPIIHCLGGVQ